MDSTKILGVDIHDALMDFRRALEEEKIIIHSPTTVRSLERVRLGPDGRVDPNTVNSEVRANVRAYIMARQTRELESQKAKTKEERIQNLLDN